MSVNVLYRRQALDRAEASVASISASAMHQ